MEKITSRLLELQIFKRISARQKLLAYLYISYLWIPMRAAMKKDSRRFRTARFRGSNASCEEGESRTDPDQSSIPRLPKLAMIYYFISTATHIVNFLNSLLLKFRSVPSDQIADDSIICYMPRIYVHEVLHQKYMMWFGLVFSSLHLSHRGFMIYGIDFCPDVITFLLMDESDFNEDLQSLLPSEIRDHAQDYCPESLMFLGVNRVRKHGVRLQVRPNRTPEAREELMRLINLGFNLLIILFLAEGIILWPISWSRLLFRHEVIYEGCRISYYDSVYWIRNISSAFVNLIGFIDSYFMLTLPLALASIFIVDLVRYWSAIEGKMLCLRVYMGQSKQERSTWITEQSSLNRHKRIMEGEQHVHEVSALIGDFFRNLTRTNEFVSLYILLNFVTWFVTNSSVTLLGLQLSGSSNITIRLAQLVGIVILTTVSYFIMSIKRRTEPAYNLICSLMALDVRQRKTDWIEIIEHYTDKQSLYAFTFPGLGVFDTLLFFQLISYLLSLTTFVEQYEIHITV